MRRSACWTNRPIISTCVTRSRCWNCWPGARAGRGQGGVVQRADERRDEVSGGLDARVKQDHDRPRGSPDPDIRRGPVAEACNGMRLVFPLVLITFVFAFSIPLRNRIRAVLLLASPLVALVCNVIRTVPTVWVHGQFPDGRSAFPEQFHTAAGWAMLPLAFVVLLVIIRLMRWAQLPIQRYTLASQ